MPFAPSSPGAARVAKARPMMFARIDQSPVARWWWTVDRWSLGALVLLIAFGSVLSMAASPASPSGSATRGCTSPSAIW